MTAPTKIKWEIEGHYFVPACEQKDTSRWYNCAHCDAGYPDQECTCENEVENNECPKGTHESLDDALGCWKCQNASLSSRRAKND